MKRSLSLKLVVVLVVLCTVTLAACGWKIRSVYLSTDAPCQGEEIDMYVEFGATVNYGEAPYYLLFGVRVPSDWDYSQMLTAENYYSVEGGGADHFGIEFKECEAYAKFLEFCYPREGYKWICFQTPEMVTLKCIEVDTPSDCTITTLSLRVGQKMGKYNLDVIAGGWKFEPSTLLKDGELVLDEAFGWDYQREKNMYSNVDKSAFAVSEYLIITGTLSQDEISERQEALSDCKITIDGEELPVCPRMSNASYTYGESLMGEVKASTGLNSVEANDAVVVKAGGEGAVKVFTGARFAGASVRVYDMAGELKGESAVDGGCATVSAGEGVRLVVVNNGDNRVVKKVVVK